MGYVEAHGTGTALGDPIEVQALAAALGAGRPVDDPLAIGSVKTNIGHLEAVAGVAGLIKAVLVLQNAEIPPHLHLDHPNPHIDWASLPLVVPTERTAWSKAGPRIAGVSAFGFSGTNVHVVLEAAATAEAPPADPRPAHLLALSAASAPALRALAGRHAAHLVANPALSLADLCATANAGRSHFAYRLALIADSVTHMRDQLEAYAAGDDGVGVTGVVTSADPPKVAFLFTGQGAQYAGMARELYELQPDFRATLDRCAATFERHLDVPLLDVIFAEPGSTAAALLDQTAYTQPALFAVEYALAELWSSWGVHAQALLGHSVGEYVAAVLAGVFSLEDAVDLIAARGRLMQALPAGGSMTAIFAPAADVDAAAAPHAADLAVAAVNGPAHTVISGHAGSVDALAASFLAAGVRVRPLAVSHAFHSPLMQPMLSDFAEVAERVTYHPPRRTRHLERHRAIDRQRAFRTRLLGAPRSSTGAVLGGHRRPATTRVVTRSSRSAHTRCCSAWARSASRMPSRRGRRRYGARAPIGGSCSKASRCSTPRAATSTGGPSTRPTSDAGSRCRPIRSNASVIG